MFRFWERRVRHDVRGKYRDENISQGRGERDCTNRPAKYAWIRRWKIDKKKNIKWKPMHKHFIHAQSYITRYTASDACFLIWNRNFEWRKVLHLIKASERPSGRKKINSDESKFSKNFKSQPNWQSMVSPDRHNKLSLVRSAYEAKPN